MKLQTFDATKRWLIFGVWVCVSALFFSKPLANLIRLALSDDTSSHILLIPLISCWLLYTERKRDPEDSGLSLLPAAAFLVPAVLLALFLVYGTPWTPRDRLSVSTLSFVLVLVAGFVLILGRARAKAAAFALGFLLFAVPIPDALLNKVIYWLQAGSATVAEFFFDLSGAPVLREGFVFHLPKMSIEVAQECSGIRSSLALLILAVLVAHFSFRPLWKRLLFVVAGLFMMVIKNGIRIATLTLLANYVNPDFLYGKLHHQGGVVFFLIGLALLLPVFWYLRKGEVPAGGLANGAVQA